MRYIEMTCHTDDPQLERRTSTMSNTSCRSASRTIRAEPQVPGHRLATAVAARTLLRVRPRPRDRGGDLPRGERPAADRGRDARPAVPEDLRRDDGRVRRARADAAADGALPGGNRPREAPRRMDGRDGAAPGRSRPCRGDLRRDDPTAHADGAQCRVRILHRLPVPPVRALRLHRRRLRRVPRGGREGGRSRSRALREKRRGQLGLGRLAPWDLEVDPLGRAPLRPFEDAAQLAQGAGDLPGRRPAVRRRLRRPARPEAARPGQPQGQGARRLPECTHGSPPAVHLHERRRAQRRRVHAAARGRPRLPCPGRAHGAALRLPPRADRVLRGRVDGHGDDGVRTARRVLRPETAARARQSTWRASLFSCRGSPDRRVPALDLQPPRPLARGAREPVAGAGARFGDDLDWSGLPEWRRCNWQAKLHFFCVPFYYIEYGIAQLGALQLWARFLQDPSATVEAYRAALALGRSRPLPELFSRAGLRFGFDTADGRSSRGTPRKGA